MVLVYGIILFFVVIERFADVVVKARRVAMIRVTLCRDARSVRPLYQGLRR